MTTVARLYCQTSIAAGLLLVAANPTIAIDTFDQTGIAAELAKHACEVKLNQEKVAMGIFSKESHQLTASDYRLISKLKTIKELTLYNRCNLTDETLGLLTDLPALERVQIDGALLTDNGLKQMAAWKSLKQLTLFHVLNREKFTGAGLTHLAELPQFESFGCGGSSFTDAGMEACSKLPHLTRLHIWHTPVTNAGVVHLKQLKNLRELRLAPQYQPRITEKCFADLVVIESLENLNLGEMLLDWKGLAQLKALPNLKVLTLDEVDISDADVEQTKVEFTGVKVTHKPPTAQQLEWLRKNWAEKQP